MSLATWNFEEELPEVTAREGVYTLVPRGTGYVAMFGDGSYAEWEPQCPRRLSAFAQIRP